MLIKSLEKLEMIRPLHSSSRQADRALLRSALLVNAIVLAGIIFLLNTYQGIGILPDSTRYMRLSPTPYDAPLYTWLLALTGQVADMETGAKCVGLLLVCLNTLLLWHIIWKGTASIPATALGTTAFTPSIVQRRTGRDNPVNSFADQVERLRAQLAGGDAYIVILDRVDWRFYLASEAELQRLLKLKMIRREADGRIYTGP